MQDTLLSVLIDDHVMQLLLEEDVPLSIILFKLTDFILHCEVFDQCSQRRLFILWVEQNWKFFLVLQRADQHHSSQQWEQYIPESAVVRLE